MGGDDDDDLDMDDFKDGEGKDLINYFTVNLCSINPCLVCDRNKIPCEGQQRRVLIYYIKLLASRSILMTFQSSLGCLESVLQIFYPTQPHVVGSESTKTLDEREVLCHPGSAMGSLHFVGFCFDQREGSLFDGISVSTEETETKREEVKTEGNDTKNETEPAAEDSKA